MPSLNTLKTMLDFKSIFSVSLVLFSAIDILGSIPMVLKLRQEVGTIQSRNATFGAAIFMYAFLFSGLYILELFGLDLQSFSIAGALILFLMGLEMTMGLTLFQHKQSAAAQASIVPLAFPIIAGPGTLSTILTLQAAFGLAATSISIFLNLILVYLVLANTSRIERLLGATGLKVIRPVFGIILITLAIKILKDAFT